MAGNQFDDALKHHASNNVSRSRALETVLVMAACILVAAGVIMRIWAALHPVTVSFGWFAYAPLSDEAPHIPWTLRIGPWGSDLIAAGLIVGAFWGGLVLGPSRAGRRQADRN